MKQSTTDLWFASFMVLNGHNVSGYESISRGKVRFEFSVDNATWKELKLKFNNSEASKLKQIQESLKDLGF